MSETVTESHELLCQLRDTVKAIDTARLRAELEQALWARLDALSARLEVVIERAPDGRLARVKATLTRLSTALDGAIDGAAERSQRELQWQRLRGRLSELTEELGDALTRLEVHVPSMRPHNLARNAFHVASSLTAIVLIETVLTPELTVLVAGLLTIAAWSAELARRSNATANRLLMKLFAPVAHPHEKHGVNSATWFSTALLLLALTGSPLVATLGIAALGFGDPCAALIGRRFGRHQLVNGRSLEGSLAFVGAAGLAGFVALELAHPELGLGAALGLSAIAAVSGAIAELFSRRIDDNLAIPVASAAASFCAATALGLIP